MIILVGNKKGGCGKSTTAINICAELVRRGKDVVLVDADRQSTSSRWAIDREGSSESLGQVHCIQKYDNLKSTLIDLDGRYEFVIVDPAGHDSIELRSAMLAAHAMLIPFRPSQADLDVIPDLVKMIEETKLYNEELKTLGVFNFTPTNPNINEESEAKLFLSDYPEITLLSTRLYERKVFRDALSEGKGVVEMNNSKATSEIQNLVEELI